MNIYIIDFNYISFINGNKIKNDTELIVYEATKHLI